MLRVQIKRKMQVAQFLFKILTILLIALAVINNINSSEYDDYDMEDDTADEDEYFNDHNNDIDVSIINYKI